MSKAMCLGSRDASKRDRINLADLLQNKKSTHSCSFWEVVTRLARDRTSVHTTVTWGWVLQVVVLEVKGVGDIVGSRRSKNPTTQQTNQYSSSPTHWNRINLENQSRSIRNDSGSCGVVKQT